MKNKKTICFLIFAVGKANGGHYRSLKMISENLSNHYNVLIINLGYVYSPVIKNTKVENYFIYFNGFNFISTIKRINRVLKNKSVDYIHAFDHQCLFIGRILSYLKKIPVVYTKCGGPNPKGYFPKSTCMTVFSKEDLLYFINNPKYSNSQIVLIPNRVEEFKSDEKKINEIRVKHNISADFLFLRICRIGKYYIQSINQSISLINKLANDGLKVQLLILGNIQESIVFSDLSKSIKDNPNVLIETSKEYVEDAKTIIDISDFVIGTGRGYMEASSKFKILLTPGKNTDIPILINDENFWIAFDRNFSERIEFSDNNIQNNYREIKNLLNSNISYIEMEKFKNYKRFKKYFLLETGIISYLRLYKLLNYQKDDILDLARHYIFVMNLNKGNLVRSFFKK